MTYCSRCGLPDTFPGITFDENQVCNYCLHTHVPDEEERHASLKKFEDLIEEKRGKSSYDVVLAYSGGKDSTYTLYMLRKHYNLRVLALVFDNGFISPMAKVNIAHMTDTLGATSMIVRPPFGLMKRLFKMASQQDIYSPKTLDRASSICTTCIGVIKALVLKTALTRDIPLAAYGWSPGQAPISSAIMKTNPRLQRITHRGVRDPLIERIGDELKPLFLSDTDLAIDSQHWPINIHPLAFTPYDEEAIISLIQDLGWEKPEDTDPNSTNCLLNALANHLHKQRFGFHPYAWEIAGIVRSGAMDRQDGIKKVSQDEDMKMVDYAARILNIKA
ncbi:MAG: hypothetical protein U9P80_03630 [Thermodesulfobacteriota bacterium]|nr:hypothetical protein [Thermodesulfobacteriota bacterium]